MWKMIVRVILIALLAWGFVWLADRPGTVSIEWLGYAVELPVMASILGLAAIVILLMVLFSIIRRVFAAPGAMSGFFAGRRKKKAYEAITKGIVAVGAGDASQATKFASKAARLTDNDPLTQLLTAQAAQLRGDKATVTRVFEEMSNSPDTEVLGLRGLFTQARQDGDMEKARALVERAVSKNPDLPWASRAMLALQSAERNWAGAARTLENQRRAGTITKAEEDRRRAVVLTAEALEIEDENPAEALSLSERAHKLAPDLVPAAVVAGRLLVNQANTRKAARILEKTWKLSPHPDVAEVYAFLRSGDSPQDRQTRITQLVSKSSGELEGAIALARACIDAQDWRDARKALSMYVDDRPPVRVCALMAEIEQGEHGDKGKAREWLARAVRAPRDPAWVADAHVSPDWLPVSPVTGELDAFKWKVPVEGLSQSVPDDFVAEEISEMVADDAAEADEAETITVEPVEEVVEPPAPAEPPKEEAVAEVIEPEKEAAVEAEEPQKQDKEEAAEPGEEDKEAASEEKAEPVKGNGKDETSVEVQSVVEEPAPEVKPEKAEKQEARAKPKPRSSSKGKQADVEPLRQPDDPGPDGDTAIN
ncbi:MAG: heme biosynthesis HemY N-terminal domain-containing protein [Hyphomicrobiales bacterium]